MKSLKLRQPEQSPPGDRVMARTRLVAVVVALILAACGGGSSDAVAADSDAGVSAAAESAALPTGGGSDFCQTVVNLSEELGALDEDDPTLEALDLYEFLKDIYLRLGSAAPAELEADFALMISAMTSFGEWAKDPTGPEPLDEVELLAFEEATVRVEGYMVRECGISFDEEPESSAAVDDSDSSGDVSSAATQTISAGGGTYEETLSGEYEVSCDMYGDLETGSINIYLEGPDFQSSVSSYDSGVEPGAYEGQVWVFAADPALDESVWDLQEIDGAFVLNQAESVSNEEWLFTGSFSASVADPPASIEATFSCVGLVGY